MQVLVFQTKEGVVLALPVLEWTAFITFEEDDFYPVRNVCGCQTKLELEAQDTRFRSPAKLLVFGMRITLGHRY